MVGRPPRSTRTDTLFPYTTLFRSPRVFCVRRCGGMAGVTMDVSIETLSSLERRLTVSLPADRLEGEVRARLRELSRSVQMKGFRRGKVPAKVVEQRFGAQVRNEALGDVVRDRKSTRLHSRHLCASRMPSSA